MAVSPSHYTIRNAIWKSLVDFMLEFLEISMYKKTCDWGISTNRGWIRTCILRPQNDKMSTYWFRKKDWKKAKK